MWRVKLGDDMLHAPEFGIAVSNPVLSQQLNAADALTFDITPEHALFERVRSGVLSERVTVYRDGAAISYGRILSVEARPLQATWSVTCEGELAYLADAVLPEYDFHGSPADFIAMFTAEAASQLGSDLQPGRVTIEDANDYIMRGNEKPSPLLEELLDKTVGSTAGGVLQIRHEGGSRYLDWLAEPEASGSQAIAKGSNLLEMSATLDGAAVVTSIMPLGAGLKDGGFLRLPDSPDGQVSGDVYRRGQYLYNKPLVERYGWHAQVMEWEDVTLSSNLRRKAIAAVNALGAERSIEVSAVDLKDAGYDVDAIAIGQRVAISCDEVETSMLVTSCRFAIDDPSNSSYTFGSLPKVTDADSAGDGAGWSGQNDDSNYFWHKTSQVVYNEGTEDEWARQEDNSYISPLSKYDLPDDIDWNDPRYTDTYGTETSDGIPLAHVRVYRTEQGPNYPPASTELYMGMGRQGFIRVPRVAFLYDGEGGILGRVSTPEFGADGDANLLYFNGNVEASGNVTAANIGAYLGFETSAAVSVPSGTTVTNILSFELPAGTWVVFGGVYFEANATGRRLACIGDTAAHQSGTVIRRSGFAMPASPAGVTCGKIGNIYVNDAPTTRYVNVMHGAGVSLGVTATIRAVRIR